MFFDRLSKTEQDIVRQCMNVVLNSNYIEDFEIHARLGINRQTLRNLMEQWPVLDDSSEDSDAFLAINNCLSAVCYGIHFPPGEWSRWFDTSEQEVEGVYTKWARIRGLRSTGIR
jgi:hypothetical protein